MQEQLLINNQHPVLKHHKAYGKELLPGLAYIDLIYQTFRENGFFMPVLNSGTYRFFTL